MSSRSYYPSRVGWAGLARTSLRVDLGILRRLLALGLPAAGQLMLEVAVFATATALAARLSPIWLAAPQIALNAASVTFMVPLGISSAAAVRVGQARRRPHACAAPSGGGSKTDRPPTPICTEASRTKAPRRATADRRAKAGG